MEKLRTLAAFPVERDGVDPGRSSYERFAIPHTFKPRLSVAEAAIAAGGALMRIFLGSLLFAVWGTYSLLAWNTIPNVFWRAAALLGLVLAFAASLALLLLAVSALVRMAWPQRRQ
jgi:hypothetical protein